MKIVNFVTPKAGAEHELLFNQQSYESCGDQLKGHSKLQERSTKDFKLKYYCAPFQVENNIFTIKSILVTTLKES